MANTTSKQMPVINDENAIKQAFNIEDKSLTVNGFLVGKIGHKVTLTITTTSVANDSEEYSFYDEATLLYKIKIVYADGSRELMLSAERVS